MKSDSTNKGFTLIEVMLASVLGVFVALVAVGTLRTVAGGREKLDVHSSISAEVRFAANTIRRDLQHVYRDSVAENMKFAGTFEETNYGSVTSLVFYAINQTKARANEPEADVYEVEYFQVRDAKGSALMRRIWPYPNKDDEPGGIVSAVAENIEVFAIRYLSGQEWLDEWPEDMGKLPDLVEVTVAGVFPGQTDAIGETFFVNFPRLPKVKSDSVERETSDNREASESKWQPSETQSQPGSER